MESMWQIEILILQFLQTTFSSLTGLFSGITTLGSEEFFMLIMPALYWSIDSTIGFRTAVILLLSSGFNGFFKLMLHNPRPFWYSSLITAQSSETSFGMPSGHAMNTIAVWGLMAAQFKKKWLTIVSVVVIILVGFSRLVLGMHFISDVVSGWLLGGILLFLFIRLEPAVTSRLKKMTLAQHLGLAIATSLGLIAICYIPLLFMQGWQMPAQWVENARLSPLSALPDPFDQSGVFTGAGIWLGFCVGAAWIHSRGGYSAKGSGTQLFVRYLIGVIGIAVLWFGLGQILPHTTDALGMGFRYMRYTVVGIWISGAAPALFIKMKLTQPVESPFDKPASE
jgi:membrane-associated phospholipid phosphatase